VTIVGMLAHHKIAKKREPWVTELWWTVFLSFLKTQKKLAKVGGENSFIKRKIATENTCLCKTLPELRKRKDYYS
jgi:hypothetical protein